MTTKENRLIDAKRVVIKVGSSLLVNSDTGAIHREWLNGFLDEISELWQQGKQVVLVSSGSISLGRRHLQFKNPRLQLEEKQAAAAVGQIRLAHAYQEALAAKGISVAQVLLTLDDSENRRRYLNAKNTLEILLKMRAIPVINENDTVATAEIRYGDNDRLAARVAQMVSADTLVLLSDVDGLYTANPRLVKDAVLLKEVKALTPEIMAMAGDAGTEFGTGGMVTKLAAAKIAMASGCRMVIAAGRHLRPLTRIDEAKENTWFIPDTTPANARKNWIAQHLKPQGELIIDAGAAAALRQGGSLLSVGVIEIKGNFHKGEAVCILNEANKELARGLSNYSAQEAKKIRGQKSADFEKILGYSGSAEIIHRDDLACFIGTQS